ncbi:MAG: DUF3228 family protein [Patescibacteria group bacterium]|nr:DUF3228 family protein [Patescibacteria group bacterium]
MSKVTINSFVRRQTVESKFSHFEESWEELVALVEAHMDEAKPGYRDGILLVPVPAAGFKSGVVLVNETTELKVSFGARRRGEEPYVDVVALGGQKLDAGYVEIVLYAHYVLAEENEAETDADYEIISINARATAEPEPQHPVSMARNFLQMAGGTKAEYTAEQFAESIIYWSTRAMKG